MDSAETGTIRRPFIEHIQEFRRRLIWSVIALLVGGSVGYYLYEWLLDLIQKPIGQTLYYTSPTGGFNFAFKICIVFGLVFALPVISYHLFKFLEPVSSKQSRMSILAYSLWSIDLAYAGMLFGYFISLPAALHFLTKFGGENIQSLITADEYFSFALAYIGGFALLFQLPLIVMFLNRINPLDPGSMFKAQKFVILGSFIIAAILTPTPDPMNQLLMAFPIVALYQISILMVWFANRKNKVQKSLSAHSSINPHLELSPMSGVSESVSSDKPVSHTVETRARHVVSAHSVHTPRVLINDFKRTTAPRRPQPLKANVALSESRQVKSSEGNDFKRTFSHGRNIKLIDVTV